VASRRHNGFVHFTYRYGRDEDWVKERFRTLCDSLIEMRVAHTTALSYMGSITDEFEVERRTGRTINVPVEAVLCLELTGQWRVKPGNLSVRGVLRGMHDLVFYCPFSQRSVD